MPPLYRETRGLARQPRPLAQRAGHLPDLVDQLLVVAQREAVEPLVVAALDVRPALGVSIGLIVMATSSMWPYSSAEMFASRSSKGRLSELRRLLGGGRRP
jgi:hypothetical protein